MRISNSAARINQKHTTPSQPKIKYSRLVHHVFFCCSHKLSAQSYRSAPVAPTPRSYFRDTTVVSTPIYAIPSQTLISVMIQQGMYDKSNVPQYRGRLSQTKHGPIPCVCASHQVTPTRLLQLTSENSRIIPKSNINRKATPLTFPTHA